MMRPIREFVLLTGVAAVFSACSLGGVITASTPGLPPTSGKGGLILTVSDGFGSARTLAPPIVMQIASFDIHGSGPDPVVDKFDEVGNTTGELVLSDLTPGLWSIAVDARNPYVEGDPNQAGTVIGGGQSQVTITAYAVASVSIVIAPLAGQGTLDLELLFPGNTMRQTGHLDATLTPVGGTPVVLIFTLGPNVKNPTQATYVDSTLASGYYILMLQLTRDNGSVWGTVEAVRILQEQTTSHTWDLTLP